MKMEVKTDHDYTNSNDEKVPDEVAVVPSHFDVSKGIAGVALQFIKKSSYGTGKDKQTEVCTETKTFKVADALKIGKALVAQAESIKAEHNAGINTKFTEV